MGHQPLEQITGRCPFGTAAFARHFGRWVSAQAFRHKAGVSRFISSALLGGQLGLSRRLGGHDCCLHPQQQLDQLLTDYEVGVSTAQKYEVKRIDLDYFEGV